MRRIQLSIDSLAQIRGRAGCNQDDVPSKVKPNDRARHDFANLVVDWVDRSSEDFHDHVVGLELRRALSRVAAALRCARWQRVTFREHLDATGECPCADHSFHGPCL